MEFEVRSDEFFTIVAGRLHALVGFAQDSDVCRLGVPCGERGGDRLDQMPQLVKLIDYSVGITALKPPRQNIGIQKIPMLSWAHQSSELAPRFHEALGSQHS